MSTIKNSPALMTVLGNIYQLIAELEPWLIANEVQTADGRLAILVNHVGEIVDNIHPEGRADDVTKVAASVVLWLRSLHLSDQDIAQRIADERIRQRELFANRSHTFSVDDPMVDWPRKLRVLVEEVGEVAHAIDQLDLHPRSKSHKAHLLTELIQVAAVCVAWLESMEVAS